MIRFALIAVSFLFFSFVASAQSYKKLVKTGDKFYEEGYYQEAINSYLEAEREDPGDLNLTLKIGLAYLKGSFKDRALPYLQKVHSSGETNAGMKYHLGLAYQYNHQFEEALEYFKIYREEAENTFLVDQHIKQCNIGIEYFNNPKEVKASNMRVLNSQYQDYAPLITADGNTLIFTSRRKGSTGGKLAYDNNYYEDIYVSRRENEQWTKPASISNQINTEYHECAAAISPDGTKLFIYSDEGEGDFYYSTYDGTRWSKPEAVSGVNSAARELSISVNAEGNKVLLLQRPRGRLRRLRYLRVGAQPLRGVRKTPEPGSEDQHPRAMKTRPSLIPTAISCTSAQPGTWAWAATTFSAASSTTKSGPRPSTWATPSTPRRTTTTS